jgi:hypothetical protein
MAHFKCEACSIRVHVAGGAGAGPGADPCPVCGRPLEPVRELAELVGLPSITPREPRPAATPSAAGCQRLADTVAAIVALRDAP